MKKLFLITILCCSSLLVWAGEVPQPKIIGYIPDYSDASAVNYSGLTHAIFCFLNAAPDGSLKKDQLYVPNLEKYLDATAFSGAHRMISLSGENLGTISTNKISINRLCDTLVSFCQHFGFEGLDLDWEGLQNQYDSSGYNKVVSALKTRLQEEDLQLVLTIGFGDYAGKWYPDEALRQADWLQIMVYDAKGTWSTSPMDNHSSFQDLLDADLYWTQRGYSRSQMVIGVPFYGRKFSSIDGGWSTARTYSDIAAAYPDLSDDENRTPGNDLTFFNGPDLIHRKCQFIMDSSYAGIFMWEMTQDVAGVKSLHHFILCSMAWSFGCMLTPPNCKAIDLETGLITLWDFSGNTDNRNGSDYNGIATNAVLTNDRWGNSNEAYYFSGNSRIDIASGENFYTNDFTISAWIKLDATTYNGIQPIVSKFDSYPGSFSFFIENKKLAIYLQNSGTKFVNMYSYESLQPDVWYHIAVTHDHLLGTRLYINGQWQNEDLQAVTINTSVGQGLRLGASSNFGYRFYGSMDDVCMYSKAMDICTIDSLYRKPQARITPIHNALAGELFQVFPNPSTGSFTVNLLTYPQWNTSLILTNEFGQVVQEWDVQEQQQFYAADLSAGLYFLTLMTGEQRSVKKMVVMSK